MKAIHQQLRERTKDFAIRMIRMARTLPDCREAKIIAGQALRCCTTMAANCRAAGRSRSRAEFMLKLGTVVDEADETVFWLELLRDSGVVEDPGLEILLDEANELLATLSATARRTAQP